MADLPELGREQILHVAKLARLTLRDDEVPTMTAHLVEILGHVAQLAEVDTDAVEPTAQVGVERMPLRPDEPKPTLPRDRVLAEAPDTAGGGFVVPAFVDD